MWLCASGARQIKHQLFASICFSSCVTNKANQENKQWTLIYKLGGGYEQTEYYFPTCTKPCSLAVTTMKLSVLTISFLFLTLFSCGQQRNDTTVTIKYIDSLKRELADLKGRNNFLYWSFQEKTYVHKIDTVIIRADSSIITSSLKDGKPLKRQFNVLGKDNDLLQYTIHYYDNKGQVRYIENWNTLKDDYFDAKLSSAERLQYDSLGRQILSVKYLQSVRRTIRTEYSYDLNGERQAKTVIIKSDALWVE